MSNQANPKRTLIAIFVPIILLVMALAIMDGVGSYWDEFAEIWLIWVIYLTIVFIFEWKFLAFGETNNKQKGLVLLSKETKLKMKKILKWSFITTLIFLVLTLVLIPVGYFYNNQNISIEEFELFDGEIRGNWEKGNLNQYSTRIKNNSIWDAKTIIIKLSIQEKDSKIIIDEIEIKFAEYNFLPSDFTKRFIEETKSYSGDEYYPILSGLPKDITWSHKIISAKKVTFIDNMNDWF